MNLKPILLLNLLLPLLSVAQSPELLTQSKELTQQNPSIRGSRAEGISINGARLHSTELPLPAHLLTAPEIEDQNINFQTHPQTNRLQTTATIGTQENDSAALSAYAAGVNAFTEAEKARRIDHAANGSERLLAGAYLQKQGDVWLQNILAAHEQKDSGAQGYYGIPQTLYAEERTQNSLLLWSALRGDLYSSFFRTGTAFQRLDRQYEIPSANFKTHTRSLYASLFAEGQTIEIQHIALTLRGDLEHEQFDGTLGLHRRTRGSLRILPEARFDRITLAVGLDSVFLSGESAQWLPRTGIDYFATDNIKLFSAYSETIQQPDLQALYESDPYHIANSTLPLQHSHNLELGLHQFLSAELDWKAAAFQRRIEHAWDWTKSSAADIAWTATDLGSLDLSGIDAKLNYLASENLHLQLYYQWIAKDDAHTYAGLYELDYPEHLLALTAHWQFTPELRLTIAQTLRQQADHPERTRHDFGADASLGLQYAPRFANNVFLSLQVDNLWGSDFQPIAGLKPRGRTASAGITVNW